MTVTVSSGARGGIGSRTAEQLAQHRSSMPTGTQEDSSEGAAAAVADAATQLDRTGVLAW
jgi:hypothetical protein